MKPVELAMLEDNFTKEEAIPLGKGELGCFVLARNSRDSILIDDQKARTIAKGKGLKVASIPAFLLFCKRKKVISLDDILEIMKDLKEKDYYEFSEESKELLLK